MKKVQAQPQISFSGSLREEVLRSRVTNTVSQTAESWILAGLDNLIRQKVSDCIEGRLRTLFAERGIEPREDVGALADVQATFQAMVDTAALDSAIASLVDSRLHDLLDDVLPVNVQTGQTYSEIVEDLRNNPLPTPKGMAPDKRIRDVRFGGKT